MDKLKKFRNYLIWIILFWIFSDILIYAGLNSTYKDMNNIGTIPLGVYVTQMQSTKVNGIIKLEVNDPELSGKYIKIDLYSNIGNLLGTQYLEIGNVTENQPKTIEKYFKITDVKKYEITVVDEMGESTDGYSYVNNNSHTICNKIIYTLNFKFRFL